ncbi:BREX system Lon protease-like protein BrxL [Streptomyces sp. NPDC058145]|uniref:BREX system Lon protease-like protein BrxL n=1 Tax=Streptomyces sp. NPDC058145 TaxID=3346356 RepID=UPI0036E85A55
MTPHLSSMRQYEVLAEAIADNAPGSPTPRRPSRPRPQPTLATTTSPSRRPPPMSPRPHRRPRPTSSPPSGSAAARSTPRPPTSPSRARPASAPPPSPPPPRRPRAAIPFVERNYNLVELGPKGTGKSHIFSEFSPPTACSSPVARSPCRSCSSTTPTGASAWSATGLLSHSTSSPARRSAPTGRSSTS